MRLTWVQPEDLLLHAFVQAQAEGTDVSDLTARWLEVAGTLDAPVSGAAVTPASDADRDLARRLLEEVEARTVRHADDAAAVFARSAAPVDLPTQAAPDRVLGAWLGRAAGCLLGKPVEKIPRVGIRAILDDLGEWPLRQYFTEQGLDPAVGERYPWNRRSRPTSLRENIAGMAEDDDLNYPLLNLELLERLGDAFTVDDVATSWLANLPAGRVFTAERGAYRNLLDGVPPALAGSTRNPFREWIGALIRGDVFGWTHPGRPREAAALAFVDASLSHVRDGIHGEMWVAGAAAASVVADDLDTVLRAGGVLRPRSLRAARGGRLRRRDGSGSRPSTRAWTGCTPATATCTGCTCSTTQPRSRGLWRPPRTPTGGPTSGRRSPGRRWRAGTPTRRAPPSARWRVGCSARRRCRPRGSTRSRTDTPPACPGSTASASPNSRSAPSRSPGGRDERGRGGRQRQRRPVGAGGTHPRPG